MLTLASRYIVSSSDHTEIEALLNQYKDSLNDGSTSKAVSLYTPDGIFMPQHSQAAIGTEQLHKAYDAVFAALDFNVAFDIKEIVPVAPEWAFARTASAGTTKALATGQNGAENNQELFVLQKLQGAWKIARYSFSTTNPPK